MNKHALPQKKHPAIQIKQYKIAELSCPQQPQHLQVPIQGTPTHRLQDKIQTKSGFDESQSNKSQAHEEDLKTSELTKADSVISKGSRNNLQKKLKTIKIKKIEEDLAADLKNRWKNQQNQEIQELLGSKNLILFMEHVMEFKLHLRDSYKNQKIQNSEKQQNQEIERESEKQKSLQKFQRSSNQKIKKIQKVQNISFSELKEKYKKMDQIHKGFACDGCDMEPIIGRRYHCNSIECWDDFDLCLQCYIKKGHAHEMKIIENNGLVKRIEGLQSMINTYKNGQMMTKSVSLPRQTQEKYRFVGSSIR